MKSEVNGRHFLLLLPKLVRPVPHFSSKLYTITSKIIETRQNFPSNYSLRAPTNMYTRMKQRKTEEFFFSSEASKARRACEASLHFFCEAITKML